ncbi:uracil-DNA glycosylase [Roseospira marina]|uniref:Type-5 uracil-DNA glycosylase n=1 Tax=Roseospira marina TaxID=140057 RepID=A0A5M6IGK2_9PROT|nr:uracil-DNA glycosylase [Roseospira marina]KAA5606708.1 uracil-DNA glycosylase [Roseospira marina]MBB4313878.1 uracil-DNA glycosylase family 4 [Roseospira marina]MBB5087040.1 uracil-DNA glycosylase family 4 [Roseospira marina]
MSLPDLVPPRQPAPDCALCPRLAAYRASNAAAHPDWFNAPVPPFGPTDARLLVVGLAPGVRGANRTGRPFTGDFAGDLLYETLSAEGLAAGTYAARPDDGFTLRGARIVNAVRCVPPENKPTPAEINTCRPFLIDELDGLSNVRVILALGKIAHDSVVRAFGQRLAAMPFAHGAVHALPEGRHLFDTYHCSRYNQNTRRLTPEMFRTVVAACAEAAR